MYIMYKNNALYITYYTNIQWRAISLSLFSFIWDTITPQIKANDHYSFEKSDIFWVGGKNLVHFLIKNKHTWQFWNKHVFNELYRQCKNKSVAHIWHVTVYMYIHCIHIWWRQNQEKSPCPSFNYSVYVH